MNDRRILKRSVVHVAEGEGFLTVLLLSPRRASSGSDYVAELQFEHESVVRVEVTALLKALTPEAEPS